MKKTLKANEFTLKKRNFINMAVLKMAPNTFYSSPQELGSKSPAAESRLALVTHLESTECGTSNAM